MRKGMIVIVVIAFSAIITDGFGQQATTDSFIETITSIFKTGNSSELGKYLNPTVDLDLLNEENIFSKAQAELLIKDFFSRNKPTSFKINHQGNKGNTSFAIGTLVTQSGSYRVSVFMKTENDKLLIHQLRIEQS